MAGGYGKGRFGALPWGLQDEESEGSVVDVSEDVEISESLSVAVSGFQVLSAEATSSTTLTVLFSADLDLSFSPNFEADNYSIPGLTVTDVAPAPWSQDSVILTTTYQGDTSYTLTVTQARNSLGDPLESNTATFGGFPNYPNFVAAGQAPRKVQVVFSMPMVLDETFGDPVNYTITKFDGTVVPVTSVTALGDRRAELALGADLASGSYYTLQVAPAVVDTEGFPTRPSSARFQWENHKPARISISFESFSGEVSGGILGSPDGQVFFSPALEAAAANSVLEVDSVAVCTKAYDTYTIPSIPDPPVLFTWPGANSPGVGTNLGAGIVLWAPAPRLGLARMDLHVQGEETFATPVDGPADAILVETIDITRASFLNDSRWRIFPGTGASLGPFRTADNQTPIGPGPTQNINLQP